MSSISGTGIVGVIPAAGKGSRLAPLPCSKELLPVGVHREPAALRGRPKVVSQYLVEQMRAGGADRIFFVVRGDKSDIAQYYGDGARLGVAMAYLMMGEPWGPAFTVAQAAPFAGDATVLFGFPDILLHPPDGFARAVARLDETGADLVLGLLVGAPENAIDPVTTDASGRVRRLLTKEESPPRHEGDLGYMLAAWRPPFTRFLVEETRRLAQRARAGDFGPEPEWPMGAVLAAAIRAGLHVDSVLIPGARFLDTGTPAGLAAAREFPGVWTGRD